MHSRPLDITLSCLEECNRGFVADWATRCLCVTAQSASGSLDPQASDEAIIKDLPVGSAKDSSR